MDKIREQSDEYGGVGSSDYFQFGDKKATYRMRILNEPTVIATHFTGVGGKVAVVCVGKDKGCKLHGKDEAGADYKKPSIKLSTYIIDRADGKVKLADLPLSLSYSFNDLQEDDDFTFDEFPMPYDVKIIHDPENSDPKAKYRLTPVPNRSDLTEAESAEFHQKMEKQTPEQYVNEKKRKQMQKDGLLAPDASTETIKEEPEYPESAGEPEF